MPSDAKGGGGPASASPAAAPLYYGFPADSLYDTSALPDFATDFLAPEDLDAFVQALATPDPLPQSPQSPVATTTGGATPVGALSKRNSAVWGPADGDGGAPAASAASGVSVPSSGPAAAAAAATGPSLFISAKNDWAPVYERVVPPGGEQPADAGTGPAAARWKGLVPRLVSALWPSRGGAAAAAAPSSTAAGGEGTTPTSASRRWRRGHKSPQQQHQQQQQQQRQRAAATAASTAAGKRARAKPGPGPGRRTQDETREGYLYGLLKWPFLLGVFCWLVGLSLAYLLTRLYVTAYEQLVTWRGRREQLRHRMRSTSRYADWVAAAQDMDAYLGNDRWKEDNEFAFYDSRTVRRVTDQLRRSRVRAEAAEAAAEAAAETNAPPQQQRARGVEDLTALLEACVKNNFAGVENRHLYSRTYYGTKNLVQAFVDETERSLAFLLQTRQLDAAAKRALCKRLYANYGRTALCLSGGASFAYYHFGVVKALLEADLLPDVITGTSGGALVAALVATRTNDELRQLLVPALAEHINACSEPLRVWLPRWWRTGARFDAVDWARQCAWWTRGSMTFREAYARTGRVLNVTCVPADPHSPTILCNYRTAPDCVIWSAVLASAAVPGILNPVVLMMKKREGADGGGGGSRLAPYAFGHKWKDGSLRTDIPLKALNRYFNVNFTVVSQVNPHVNLFFFSSRGSVGQPVTHRKGRGWRGGYLGSAFEEYLKQDLRKWLKLLRNLELLPRPLGQDWSQLWLQPFGGTITIWPQAVRPADVLLRILADPDPPRLARMLHEGQQSVFPPLKFISNRLRIERLLARGARGRDRDRDRDRGRHALRNDHNSGRSNNNSLDSISDNELARLARRSGGNGARGLVFASDDNATSSSDVDVLLLGRRFGEDGEADTDTDTDSLTFDDDDDNDDDDDDDDNGYEGGRNVGTIPEEAEDGGRVL